MTDRELMAHAIEARKNAYAPYSHFRVGAALLTSDGRVYTGCNIENAAYTPTNCAERTAFFKAVSEGVRAFSAIAVAGGGGAEPDALCAPCGVCRQVMAEFCGKDFRIILGNAHTQRVVSFADLLPLAFSPKNLEESL